MSDRTVRAIVQDAISGDLSIPEFQREFEWKQDQVAKLCNSLYKGLPIGIFTVWNTSQYKEPQTRPVTGRIPVWIVDGQQRITSLCIILGEKPSWMDNEEWREAFGKRVYLNIYQDGQADIGRLYKKAKLNIALDEIIHKNPGEAQRYVQDKCTASGILMSQNSSDLAVNSIRILDRVIPVSEVGDEQPIEEIAELYRRLNTMGTRLRQAQIMLAYVSQFNRGWVREQFYPFLEDLKSNDDWELDPAQVLLVATILAEGKARVGAASTDMWKSKVTQVWPHLKTAIDSSIVNLWDRGITDQDMIPSGYTIIALLSMEAKFGAMPEHSFDRLFQWFVGANLSGRYGDAPLETLTKDGQEIFKASNLNSALEKLVTNWTKQDLSDQVGEKFRDNSSQALLLHIVLWRSNAKDWIQRLSMGALTQAARDLEPHWHHIIPQAWGRANGFQGCDRTANVTRLCGETNVKKLRTLPPWEYVPKFGIPKEALLEHLVPDKYAEKFVRGQPISPNEFKEFLRERENLIVQQGAALLGL